MTASLRKVVSGALMLSTTLAMTGLGMAGIAQAAGQLNTSTVTLSDVTSNQTSVTYTIAFKPGSTTPLGRVKFDFRQNASTDATVPDNFANGSATKSAVTIGGTGDTSNWTLDKTTTGTLIYTATTDTGTLSGSPVLSFATANVHSNTVSASTPCDSVTNSETCWVRITTYASDNSTVVDNGTATYTVINTITVTATIDPVLTFTVAGVNSGTTSDANAGATSVTTTATTIPFGNVALGSAKVATQDLKVLTNANNGYTVYNKFNGSAPATDLMVGTYSANNIDPFDGGTVGTGWAEDGGSNASAVWSAGTYPNGPDGTTRNVDTAWLGIRSSNANVSGFSSANVWAPPYVGSSIGKKVMIATSPDNGTVATYVSFKVQSNAFEPSDQYTGTTVYNVVASY
ncbi:MAG: hypothetical protein WCO52_00750 [bacterium]